MGTNTLATHTHHRHALYSSTPKHAWVILPARAHLEQAKCRCEPERELRNRSCLCNPSHPGGPESSALDPRRCHQGEQAPEPWIHRGILGLPAPCRAGADLRRPPRTSEEGLEGALARRKESGLLHRLRRSRAKSPHRTPNTNGKVFLGVGAAILAAFGVFALVRSQSMGAPRTMNKEWKEAQTEYAKEQKMDTFTCVSRPDGKGKTYA